MDACDAEDVRLIEKFQVDWETGEWHAQITPDGRSQGDKAQPWKARYHNGHHNGRAMVECLHILKALRR